MDPAVQQRHRARDRHRPGPGQVVLTNAAGVHADALGENVMVAILFHAKHLAERLENQREKA